MAALSGRVSAVDISFGWKECDLVESALKMMALTLRGRDVSPMYTSLCRLQEAWYMAFGLSMYCLIFTKGGFGLSGLAPRFCLLVEKVHFGCLHLRKEGFMWLSSLVRSSSQLMMVLRRLRNVW